MFSLSSVPSVFAQLAPLDAESQFAKVDHGVLRGGANCHMDKYKC